MPVLLFLLLGFSALASALGATREKGPSVCSGKADGFYVIKPCSKDFYICRNSTYKDVECPQSLVLDTVSLRCIPAAECVPQAQKSVTTYFPRCANMAKQKVDVFPIASHMQTFAKCIGAGIMPEVCPDASVFDEASVSCIPNDNCTHPPQGPDLLHIVTHSGATQTRDLWHLDRQQCTGIPNGIFAISVCHGAFYCCVSGTFVAFQCPDSLVFDMSLKRCVHRVLCSRHIKTDTANPCAEYDNGIYSVGPCLSTYVHCVNRQAAFFVCGHQFAFSNQLQACLPQTKCEMFNH